jgi:hypothetical protein
MQNIFDLPQIGTIVPYLILLVGFAMGFILYKKLGTRVGGVMAIPLAVVYCLAELKLIPVLIGATIITSLIGYLFFQLFLLYGRRMLYIYAGISIVVTMPLVLLVKANATVYMSIIPGLLAYNFHREVNSSGLALPKSLSASIKYYQIAPGLRSTLNWLLRNGKSVGTALLFFVVLYGIGRFLMLLPPQQAVGLSLLILIASFVWLGFETNWLTIRLPRSIRKGSIG